MKVLPVALAAHYASLSTTLACFLKITRADGLVYGFTETDHAVVIDGVTYESGFDVSQMAFTAGLGVDNFEVSVTPEGAGMAFDVAELLAGRWDGAKFVIFECNYKALGDGVNVLRRGTTGQASEGRSGYTLEFRSLKQALQQQLGEVTTKTCRARLGDDRCRVNLAPWTHTYAVTSVASRRLFTCSAAVEVADYYKEGTAHGDDAANAGYVQKVKAFAAGVFELSLPMPFPVVIGDTFTFVAGCQKRLLEDCKTKFSNVLNFQGEPHIPGPDLLTADPVIGN